MAGHRRASRRYSKAEMERLEKHLRKHNVQSHVQESDSDRLSRRRRSQLIRFTIVAVFAFALIGTWIEHKLPDKIEKPPPPPPGTPLPVFGDAAKLMPGTMEVTDGEFPALKGLADGSLTARETQKGVAEEHNWPIEIENSIGMRFRLIPHGSFVMGSPENEVGRGPDEAAHVVLIEQPFYLAKFEVTQEQWEQVMGPQQNPSQMPGARRPVEEVNWRMCQEFLATLADLEQVPAWSYRLPTEEEWEYACRAGTQTRYYCGDQDAKLRRFALFAWNVADGTEIVGQRRPNAWGLHNMHGNVWEWCEDLFAYYDNPDIVDRQRRVIRGGNWHLQPNDCRSASRFRLPPDSNSNLLGFRVVRSIYEHHPKPLPPPPPPEKW